MTPLGRPSQPSDLTICICTVGRPDLLPTALASLFAYTPSGVTFRLVLNGLAATDIGPECRKIVDDWDGPSEIVELPDKLDIAASHNTALQLCSTPYITFMGDDDLVLEERTAEILAAFDDISPTPAIIGSFCRRVTASSGSLRFSTNKDYGPTTVEEWEKQRDSGELIELVFPSAVYRTDLLREIGGFRRDHGSAIDVVSFTKLGTRHPVLALQRRTFAHGIHPGSITSSQPMQHDLRLKYAAKCVEAFRQGRDDPDWTEFERAATGSKIRRFEERSVRAKALFRQGGARYASGSRSRGVSDIARAVFLSPRSVSTRLRAQLARPANSEPVVSILLKNCNQYRVPFYEALRTELRKSGIELRLIFGYGLDEDAAKGDRAQLAWAEYRPIQEISLLGRQVLWQSGFGPAFRSDLIVTEQASKQLFNAVLTFGGRLIPSKHAFWGHGRNFQQSIEDGSGEGLKRAMTKRSDWFFAYNELSRHAVIESGFDPDRVTSVMNSTDTEQIRSILAGLALSNDGSVRDQLDLGHGPVALYLGGLYAPKRIDFLLESSKSIQKAIPNFRLLIIGGGSGLLEAKETAADLPWVRMTGPIYGDERIRLASVASLQLMPGLVGLNIVDAFGLGIPTITTAIDYHSPEIDYLKDGTNGLILPGDCTPADFGGSVAELLTDRARLQALCLAAHETGLDLTVENMARRFADGVVAALAA